MDNFCIKMVMKGKELKLDEEKAVALAAYVTSLSNGVEVQIGGK